MQLDAKVSFSNCVGGVTCTTLVFSVHGLCCRAVSLLEMLSPE